MMAANPQDKVKVLFYWVMYLIFAHPRLMWIVECCDSVNYAKNMKQKVDES